MPHSDRPKSQRQEATNSFNQHMADVASYLAKVRSGRSVKAANPFAPQYSQAADDARLASRGQIPAGYGSSPTPDAIPTAGFGQAFTTPSGTSPTYGFSNTYKPSPQAEAFGYIVDHLMDPRVGMAFPGMGMTSRFSNWRNFLHGKPKPDPGGFNVPHSQMVKQEPTMYNLAPIDQLSEHPGTIGRERTAQYLTERSRENAIAEGFFDPSPLNRALTKERYTDLLSYQQENINKVLEGQRGLRGEMALAQDPKTGGAIPNEMVLRLFGFKE